jgi:hypothetical protein
MKKIKIISAIIALALPVAAMAATCDYIPSSGKCGNPVGTFMRDGCTYYMMSGTYPTADFLAPNLGFASLLGTGVCPCQQRSIRSCPGRPAEPTLVETSSEYCTFTTPCVGG